MKIHHLPTARVSSGGFDHADRSGGHRDVVRPGHDDGVWLHVAGARNTAGFGVCGTPSGMFHNLGPGRGTAAGPSLAAYGRASVIAANGRGTGWMIEQAKEQGRYVYAEIGDLVEWHGDYYRIEFEGQGSYVDRHNIRFVRVAVEVTPITD